MATPSFDGFSIFSYIYGGDTITAGVCDVLDYSGIFQNIHFNGEDGERTLSHGWGNRQWKFEGTIWAASADDLKTALGVIENHIDEAVEDPSDWKTLVTSFGQTFSAAQVRHLARGPMTITTDGYLCQHIVVTGVTSGMRKDAVSGT